MLCSNSTSNCSPCPERTRARPFNSLQESLTSGMRNSCVSRLTSVFSLTKGKGVSEELIWCLERNCVTALSLQEQKEMLTNLSAKVLGKQSFCLLPLSHVFCVCVCVSSGAPSPFETTKSHDSKHEPEALCQAGI